MILDGIKCVESKAYGWRHGDPTRDVDRNGNPVQNNYIVIVRIKDCRLYEKDGKKFYDPLNAPQAFKLAYGGTYYGYGEPKTIKDGLGRWVGVSVKDVNGFSKTEKVWLCSYIKTPMYFVRKGRIYIGACYRAIGD